MNYLKESTFKTDFGHLIMRLTFGLTMLIAHGWPKFVSFGERAASFPDILGIGSTANLALVVFAEVLCAGLIAIGLFTRMACVPLLITMLVAFFVIHGEDPFQKKEMAFLYLCAYAAIFFSGPGKFSIQNIFKISVSSRLVPLNWLLK